jgi:hypothetical protein
MPFVLANVGMANQEDTSRLRVDQALANHAAGQRTGRMNAQQQDSD